MEQTTNPLQRILDLTQTQNNIVFHFQQDYSHQLDNLSFLGYNDAKLIDKNQFFAQSPNPFKKERKLSNDIQHGTKHENIKSQQFFINKKINFDEQQSIFKWFGNQKDSQIFCSESSFSPKKRDFFDFSFKDQKELQQEQQEQIMQNEFKSNKNQRGLKNLSQTVYEIVKKQEKTTFNKVAALLIENIKQKMKKDHKRLQEKDEKNIKRRAYDALNVMIASEIIQKKEKFISLNKSLNYEQKYRTPSKKNQKLKNFKQNHFEWKQYLQEKIKNIQNKKIQLKAFQAQKVHIQKFFQQKDSQNQQLLQKERISFPFLCIKTSEQNFTGLSINSQFSNQSIWEKENSATCARFQEQNCVYLNFKSSQAFQSIKIQGDIDFISEVGKQIIMSQKSTLSTQVQSLSLKD